MSIDVDAIAAARLDALIQRDQANARVAVLREAINTLYDAVAHGNDEHRAWLRAKLNEHFALATTDAAAERLLAELTAARAVCEAAETTRRGCTCKGECSCAYQVEFELWNALRAWRRAFHRGEP